MSDSLQASMDLYELWRVVEGVRLTCDCCGEEREVEERTLVGKCPDTMLVSVPREGENFNRSFVFDEEVSFLGETFAVHGVVHHEGPSMLAGHYTTAIRSRDATAERTIFDDAKVGTCSSVYCLTFRCM